MPENYLDILADAITDVGYWCWWDAQFPEALQLEFGGTQLWSPPLKEGNPPCGNIALRFGEPNSVSFLTHKDYVSSWPPDWPRQLHEDALEPVSLSRQGAFTFSDDTLIRRIVREAGRVETAFGFPPDCEELFALPVRLAFWAGALGLVVGAAKMEMYNFQGEVTPEQVPEMRTQWWAYWKEYWRVRDTPDALPRDYACEVTIPAGEED